ncbi:MAG TPA: hypothetical protein VE029_02130, partial [Rhizobacter sp.]|nr:hypothetical protein [Rhizobacter sp.]
MPGSNSFVRHRARPLHGKRGDTDHEMKISAAESAEKNVNLEDNMDRRTTLKILGASGAFAGTGITSLRAGAVGVPTIAYSQAELVNDWRAVNQRDMKEHAQAAGVKFISVSADQDVSKQLSDIQNLLAQRPDVLILSPLESVALA